MGTIYIDDEIVEFKAGQSVLQATLKAGIDVPYFCYHEALGAAGACRVCAMELEPAEKSGKSITVMSCMQPAQEGQRYRLNKGNADKVRQHVVEYYMTRHPHDCPVCDEAGECHLQDMTILAHQTYRRYDGKKQTFPNQEMGPLIWNIANRCITCYRCVRFYQNYALGDDLGVYCAGQKTTFRRAEPGAFDSPFSGNLIDVCPTGTFSDKVYRRKYSRTWQLEKGASVCNHCSVGCNTEPGGREGTLRRIHPRANPEVNLHFICDRGRYGEHYSEAEDRPLIPLIKRAGKHSKAEIFYHTEEYLRKMRGRIGVLSSEHEDLQTHYMLKQLATHYEGIFSPFVMPDTEIRIRRAVQFTASAPTLTQIEQADAAIIVGSLTETAPMIDLAVRQIIAKEKPVIMIHAVPSLLAELIRHRDTTGKVICTAPRYWHDTIEHLDVKAILSTLKPDLFHNLKDKHIVTLGIANEMDLPAINALNNLSNQLKQSRCDVHTAFIPQGANAVGAAVISHENSARTLLEAVRTAHVDTLIVCGADPFGHGALEWEPLRSKIRKLIVLDNVNTETVKQADTVFPLSAWSERSGYSVNYEGRLQAFEQAYQRQKVISPTEFVSQITQQDTETLCHHWNTWLRQLSEQFVMPGQTGVRLDLQHLISSSAEYNITVKNSGLQLIVLPWHGGDMRADFAEALSSCKPWKDGHVYLHADTARQLHVETGQLLNFQSGASLNTICDDRVVRDCLAVTPVTLNQMKYAVNTVLSFHQIQVGEQK